MKKFGILGVLGAAMVLQACAQTPAQQRQLNCAGAGAAGALAGAAVGNQLGGGSGRDILTAGGAVGGGLAASRAAGC
ncbi:hypothetical protein [uncultured Roseobacter sp.]|uniref:hypothetical protein n=1 Tax=uncultured Roseobacter sp. TaxID=114847 RepID=UPI00261D0A4B|nr:hypothetical protein [uncultured Roseobacter sp.]